MIKNIKKKIFYYIVHPFSFFKALSMKKYNIADDLNFNEKILKKINFDLEKIQLNLSKNNIDYYNENISWHYHLFSGIKKNKVNKILEIGTYKGEFTNFLSNTFPDANITTIDLPKNDAIFINNYNRHSKDEIKNYEKKLKENLKNLKNVNYIEMNSIFLLNNFDKCSFDLIWIDGDHLNPQVTFDIFSALFLLKNEGYIFCDDIVFSNYSSKYSNKSSFETLKYLEKKKIINNEFILKRISKINAIKEKKYISISKKV